MITISTRASLKKYHTFNLTLGLGESGEEWEYERIGTEKEKMHVERELQELREQLAQVEEWKRRHEEIEAELAKVWVAGGEGEGEGESEGDEKEGVELLEPEYKEQQTEQKSEFDEKKGVKA